MTTKTNKEVAGLVSDLFRNNVEAFNVGGVVSVRVTSEQLWNLAQALINYPAPSVVQLKENQRSPLDSMLTVSWLSYPWND